MQPFLDKELPRALSHTDVFCDNVIVADDETAVVIMDFEEATLCERIFDLGMAIIGLCAEDKSINFICGISFFFSIRYFKESSGEPSFTNINS